MKFTYLTLLAACLCLLGSFVLYIKADENTIYIIGDSTASDYSSSSYPRTGWGSLLKIFLAQSDLTVDNRALSGRSSKSFYNESGAWNKVLSDLKEGDFLIIQFGHNDQKNDEERHTEPYTTYQEFLLKYITEAKSKGAIPILATSIHRNGWDGDQIKDSHGDYPPAMRALAAEENVPLLDLHNKTEILFESLGTAFTTNRLFLNLPAGVYSAYPEGNSDNTHLQEYGAMRIAELAAIGLEELSSEFETLTPFANAINEVGYVAATVNDINYGSVEGIGYHAKGDSVTLTAKANFSYVFKAWESGSTSSSESSFTFYLSEDSVHFSAEFVQGYLLKVLRNSSLMGSVTGGGYYAPGSTVEVIATPRDNYYFESWTINDEVISTENPLYYELNDTEKTITANFTDVAPLGIEKDVHTFEIKQTKASIEIRHQGAQLYVLDVNGRILKSFKNQQQITMDKSSLNAAFIIVFDGHQSQKVYLW